MAEDASTADGRRANAALLALVEEAYGNLTGDDRERVAAALADIREAAALLNAYPLTNADEPALTFAPFRQE